MSVHKDKKNTHKEIDQSIFQEIMKKWTAVNDVEKDQREMAIDDALFAHVAGSQWSQNDRNTRKNKPMYEINKIAPAINLVVGTQRQNEVAMKVRALGGGATKKLAETYNGLMRNIENRSKFENIQNAAFKELATGGYGAWQLTTGYANDQTFDQDISIKFIPSAANSVYYDNGSIEENFRDANWCFVIADIPVAQFEKDYSDAIQATFDSDDNGYHNDWCNVDKNTVRVADYYTKEPITLDLILMSNGKTYEDNEKFETILDELREQQITEVNRRKVKTHKVFHYRVSGAEILEDKKEWAGKFIPVIMPLGYNLWIDGIRYVRGIVRNSKDAQRLYNYGRSAIVEAANLAKKDPLWMTAEQAKGFEGEIGKDKSIQLYNSVPNQPPPFRTGSPSVQSALIEQSNQASDDVKTTTGFFDPSLGNNPANQSGRAILAQQQQGDLGTFELADNLVKGIEYTAEQLIDLLPRVYDTPRQEMIISPDGTEEFVSINETVFDQDQQKEVILNDLSVGQYSVVASNGASYSTKRSENLNNLISLGSNDPRFARASSDLIASNLDTTFSDELTKRLRKPMLAEGIIEPNEEELQKMQDQQAAQQGPSEVEQLLIEEQKLKLGNLAAEQDIKVAEFNKINAETNKIMMDTNKSIADVDKTINETIQAGGQTISQFAPMVVEDNLAIVHDNLKEESPLHNEEEFIQDEQLIQQPELIQEELIEQPINQDPLNDLDLQNQQI